MRRRLTTSIFVIACTLVGVLGAGASAAQPLRTPAQALSAAVAPSDELVQTDLVDYKGFQVSRYEQRVGGYPVIGGEATVVQAPGQPARVAADATAAVASKRALSAPASQISKRSAIAIAKRAGHVRAIRRGDRASASLAIDSSHGDTLVWRVEVPAARPMKDLEALVDSHSGRVLATGNRLQYATGKAKLYVPNPPVEQGSYAGIGTGASADHNDRDTAKLTALRRAVTLSRLQGRCLKGAFVEARYEKQAKKVCRRSRNWRGVTRSNDKFEALMAYFHIDRTQAYIQSLGFTKKNGAPINDRRQQIVADAFAPDNSFYSSNDRKLRFGSGGVDDAEDADVVIHEYGHSIQDNQDPGFGCGAGQQFCQAGALGEGFGDYNSGMMTLQIPGLPAPAAGYPTGSGVTCIFDWDGVVGWGGPQAAPCGRVADGSDGVTTLPVAVATGGPCDFGSPGNPSLDIHCVGEVWTHGLLDLRLAIGQPIDVDVLASQFTYVDNETFAQAVGALVSADTTLFGGTHVAAICAEMRDQRGIAGAPGC